MRQVRAAVLQAPPRLDRRCRRRPARASGRPLPGSLITYANLFSTSAGGRGTNCGVDRCALLAGGALVSTPRRAWWRTTETGGAVPHARWTVRSIRATELVRE